MRNIVCISGGLSSAWVAGWAKRNLTGEIIYYFNDTKWEHKDLYRFLQECQSKIGFTITEDSDGRSPEEVFYDQSMLANNRVPLCSKILKAERLQKFAKPGDVCFFGIDDIEAHRAVRIAKIYQELGVKTRFPMIEESIKREQVREYIYNLGIEEPEMYKMGFTHNNCSGGCVRAGKKQWAHLLRVMPEVYQERERVENEVGFFLGKKVSYMKDMTLSKLREAIESQMTFDFEDDHTATECIGVCNLEN